MALGRCICIQKWLDPDLDRKVSKQSHLVANLQWFWEGAAGFENCLIEIWTEMRPNEATWKRICNGFGDVSPDSKMA